MSLEWGFEIRKNVDMTPVIGNADWMDRSRKLKLTVMPAEEGQKYRFWLEQPHGTSSPVERIAFCTEAEEDDLACPGQYAIEWFARPVRVGDGRTYVIAELTTPEDESERRQVVLYLHHYRLEDMLKDAEREPGHAGSSAP